MSGAINFAMSDIYGGIFGTTEATIPEAADQTALVDDQKASDTANTQNKTTNAFPIFLAIFLIFILAIVLGGLK